MTHHQGVLLFIPLKFHTGSRTGWVIFNQNYCINLFLLFLYFVLFSFVNFFLIFFLLFLYFVLFSFVNFFYYCFSFHFLHISLFRFVFVDFVSFCYISFLFRFALYRYPVHFKVVFKTSKTQTNFHSENDVTDRSLTMIKVLGARQKFCHFKAVTICYYFSSVFGVVQTFETYIHIV